MSSGLLQHQAQLDVVEILVSFALALDILLKTKYLFLLCKFTFQIQNNVKT